MLQTIIQAALLAGKEIMNVYLNEDFEVDFKSDDSPLTKADLRSHQIIMEHLKNTNIPILSEEGKSIPFAQRKDWPQLWIVDPLDGTKEFIKRNGEFTVNIALVENQIPVMGVIYAPALRTLYYGAAGKAFRIEDVTMENYVEKQKSAKRLPLQRSSSQKPKFTVVASKSHLSKETETYIRELEDKQGEVDIISKGSSLKFCMVAEGTANEYPRFAPTMEWDTAAGQSICTSSGCDVIDLKTSKTMTYNRQNLLNNWFIARRIRDAVIR